MPAMRQAAKNLKESVELDLVIDVPIQINDVRQVMMTRKIADMAEPLFLSTGFIQSVNIITMEEAKSLEYDYDFDAIRGMNHTYQGNISKWYFHAFPELTCDLTAPIKFNPKPVQKFTQRIIVNRTPRYHGRDFDWLYLRDWSEHMLFIGLPEEYHVLKAKLPGMAFHQVNDFHEMAMIISEGELFLGNQSSPFALAEVQKVNRAVEVCRTAHNVIPTGGVGYECYNMYNMRYVLENLYPLTQRGSTA